MIPIKLAVIAIDNPCIPVDGFIFIWTLINLRLYAGVSTSNALSILGGTFVKAGGPFNFVTSLYWPELPNLEARCILGLGVWPRPPWSHWGGMHPSSKVQTPRHLSNWLRH